MGGGGDAWSKDHEEILEHAIGLGYDKVPGVSLPSADAPKETWTAAMDKFNTWKASELGKSEADRWWVTRPWSATEGDGGSAGRSRVGSAAAVNPFFPQLVPEYTPQGLLDWSGYMPEGGMFGHEQYQPWTNPNAIPENIFNYQPPTIHARSGVGGGAYGGGAYGGGGYGGGGYGDGGIPTTPITTAATGDDEPTDRWVPETPMTMSPDLNSFLGNVGADKANTLGGLLDIATGASVFTPGNYIQDKAQGLTRDYAIQNLVKETPSLQDSFDMMSTLNLTPFTPYEPERDRAQRNIDDAVAAMVKNNPEAARVMYDGAQFIDHRPGGSGPFWSGPGSEEGGPL